MYLHSETQRDSATFAQRVMSSALFSSFVDENLTFWVGDLEPEPEPEPEPYP